MTDSIAFVKQKDREDPLAAFHKCFYHPNNTIYLDGNSLGKLPLGVKEAQLELIQEQWGENLIGSWNDHWLELPQRLALQLSQLLGAQPNEIIVGESTSVRLFQIAQALARTNVFPKRMVTDNLNFPTDAYILGGIAQQTWGKELETVCYENELEADLTQLKKTIEQKPGIYCLSLVTYKSGYLYPLIELNRHARQNQSVIIWDLSHAVGVVALDFKKSETRVALGCTYKYLNGGPGSPAFLYIDEELNRQLENPIAGWFGHAEPFAFSSCYAPGPDIQKMAIGTPGILSMAALEKGLSLCLEAGIDALEQKSRDQTQWLREAITKRLTSYGVAVETPKDANRRGAHISISHPDAWRITQALQSGSPKIIPDYRPDRFIRMGLAPLYTRYRDLLITVEQLEMILKSELHIKFPKKKPTVT